MLSPVERRHVWSRIIGVERRAAPLQELEGRPLPVEDEEFLKARTHLDWGKRKALAHLERWGDPTRFD